MGRSLYAVGTLLQIIGFVLGVDSVTVGLMLLSYGLAFTICGFIR